MEGRAPPRVCLGGGCRSQCRGALVRATNKASALPSSPWRRRLQHFADQQTSAGRLAEAGEREESTRGRWESKGRAKRLQRVPVKKGRSSFLPSCVYSTICGPGWGGLLPVCWWDAGEGVLRGVSVQQVWWGAARLDKKEGVEKRDTGGSRARCKMQAGRGAHQSRGLKGEGRKAG